MTIILQHYPIPDSGRLELSLNISAEIKVSAVEARRRVNGFMLNSLSYLTVSDRESELVIGERVCWRISINHTLPGFGALGRIGTMNVDVETGEIQPVSPEQFEEMKRLAKILAGSYPLNTSPARCLRRCLCKEGPGLHPTAGRLRPASSFITNRSRDWNGGQQHPETIHVGR
jgi:hypothetical protein